LELEREIYVGELSKMKNAILPVGAAFGGVLVPAIIYLVFNYGTNSQNGAGIPMATDIAFAIGMLSLLGNTVPTSLKIFLTALAVIDDLCAIVIIALFYTNEIQFLQLGISLGIFGILLILNRLKVYALLPYLIGGVLMWYFMLQSGVHATLSGVMLAFAIPFGKGDHQSISYKIQHFLHKPVAFIIIPLFALTNTCIVFSHDIKEMIFSNEGLGIFCGLVIGKPLGITLFSALLIKLRLAKLHFGLTLKHIFGAGLLGGIGFTMSIFITNLAFTENNQAVNTSKISIIIASLTASIIGLIVLKNISAKNIIAQDEPL
jgi:NhaA family Na+:H+ antiporter